jgi:hypothetical protein
MSGGWLAREAMGKEDWSKMTCREINMQLKGEIEAQLLLMLRVVKEYTPTRGGGAIVALDTTDGASKLRGHISQVGEGGEGVILMAQWKGPHVMSAISKNNQVYLYPETLNRRRPKIIVDQIKISYNLERTRKR